MTPLPGAREQWAKHRAACWTTTWTPEANVQTEGDWVWFEVCIYIYTLYFSLDHMVNVKIFWLLLRKWHQWTIFGCQNKWNCALWVGVQTEVWFGEAVVLLNFDHVLGDKTNMNGAWLKTSSFLYSLFLFFEWVHAKCAVLTNIIRKVKAFDLTNFFAKLLDFKPLLLKMLLEGFLLFLVLIELTMKSKQNYMQTCFSEGTLFAWLLQKSSSNTVQWSTI